MKRFLLTAFSILVTLGLVISQAPLVRAAPPGAPAAPLGLTATAVSATQVDLVWQDNSDNETGFRIERSIIGSGGGGFVATGNVSANVTSFSDTTVTANTTYQYKVFANNAIGDSDPSNVVSVTIAPPSAPSALVAIVVNATRIDLTWTDNAGSESGFRLQRSTDNFTTTFDVTLPANTTSFSDATVIANTTYQYRVTAFNAIGDSAPSNVVSATPAVPIPSLLAPADGGFTNDTTPDLVWSAVANVPGVTYRIEVDNSANFTSPEYVGNGLASSNATSTELASGTYYWRVRASDNASNLSAWSAPWRFSVDTVAPAKVTLRSPGRGTIQHSHVIQFQWDSVSDPSGVTYHIVVLEGEDVIQDEHVSGTSASFDLYDTTYHWNVTAIDGAGNEGAVSEDWFFVVLNEDTIPPEIEVTSPNGGEELVGGSTFTITWGGIVVNDDTPVPELKIDIFFSPDNGRNFERIVHLEDNPGAFRWQVPNINTDQGLIKVQVTDRHGNTGQDVSDTTFTITATPGSPSGFWATAATARQVNVGWSHNGTSVSGFSIERSTDNFTSIDATFSAPADVRTFTDTTVTPSTTLAFRVLAVNGAVSSAPSNAVIVTTPAAPAPPPPPLASSGGGGGGGGGGGLDTTIVNLIGLTSDNTLRISNMAVAQTASRLRDPGGDLGVDIPTGVIMREPGGAPLTTISLATPAAAPQPPPGNVVVLAYDLGPNGATFEPAITLVLSYDQSALPIGAAESDLVIAYWDGSKWVNLATTVNADTNTLTASIRRLAMFVILAKTQPAAAPAATPVVTLPSAPVSAPTPEPTLTIVTPSPAPQPTLAPVPAPTPAPVPAPQPEAPPSAANWGMIGGALIAAAAIVMVAANLLLRRRPSKA
ncbi:MAG: fibronectin type III domain-containing protein [Chloroflexi bacterium]|nr:fibronectin type III domain-containing protein [Chloroflexota bacterium]